MARLTEEQWQEVQADYEVRDLPNTELAIRHGVTETAIRKRAKRDSWVKGSSSSLISDKVNIINNVKELSSRSSILSSSHLNAIDDEVRFRLSNDKDLQAIQDKVNLMVNDIDNPAHALALMTATVKHREARLGKQPDTAIQINNNMGSANPDDLTDDQLAAVIASRQ